MSYRRLLLLLPLLLILGREHAAAQQPDFDPIAGTTYVVAFPDTTQNAYDERFKVKQISDTVALFIYSPVATKVRITGNGYTNNVNVQANKFAEVYLNNTSNKAPNQIVDQSNVASPNVFRIEADDPVVVYCYICTKFGGETWTPLPVEAWGKEYVAAALPGEVVKNVRAKLENVYATTDKAAPAEFTILSAYDNTEVTIIPTDTGLFAGRPFLTVTLAANRAYQLQTLVDTLAADSGRPLADLTGTRIVASKPIGVMSGNTRTIVNPDSIRGLAKNSFKNMAMEVLLPVDQQGTEFVAMPLMDDRRLLDQIGENPLEKRRSERILLVTGRDSATVEVMGDTSGAVVSDTLASTSFLDDTLTGNVLNRPRRYKASVPCQAFHFPQAVVKDLTGVGGWGSYDSWGGFMVTMVPREQWATFAPYIAPIHPGAMKHYVNIVTDTNSRFKIFDENNSVVSGWSNIPGTDLCWTVRGVTPGVTKYFKATDTSAKFSAFAYGLLKGHEEFYAYFNSQYEEYLAVSYGYPIAFRHLAQSAPDTLMIDTSNECGSMLVSIKALNNGHPAGIRSIALLPNSSNAQLLFINPVNAGDIIGRDSVVVKVVPYDSLSNATGTIRITDRTGATTDIPYSYEAARLDIAPSSIINYGEVTPGTSVDSICTITNPLNHPVTVKGMTMALNGTSPFTIVEPSPLPSPNAPLIVQPGQRVQVRIRYTPTEVNVLYGDTLNVAFGCSRISLPMRGETAIPCVYAGDLDFGTFLLGQDGPRTLPLDICNQGRGEVRFKLLPNGDSVIAWLVKNFSVPRSTIDSLRDKVVLGQGECFRLWVTFTPRAEGIFIATAHFPTNADCLRDSSIWRAVVQTPSGVEWSARVDGDVSVRPTPAGSRAEIALHLRQPARVELSLVDERGTEVQHTAWTRAAGDAVLPLDVSSLPSGIYYCRLAVDGARRTIPVTVAR